jgi:hypothetical protein
MKGHADQYIQLQRLNYILFCTQKSGGEFHFIKIIKVDSFLRIESEFRTYELCETQYRLLFLAIFH